MLPICKSKNMAGRVTDSNSFSSFFKCMKEIDNNTKKEFFKFKNIYT